MDLAEDATAQVKAAESEKVSAKEEVPPAPKKTVPAVLSEAVKQNSGDAVRPITESDLKLVPDTHIQKQQDARKEPHAASVEGYKVQLAAFKSEKDAIDSWKKIQRAHMDLLGNLQYYIERKEVEGKGTFYRLQAGVVTKESEARLLCKKLSEVKQGCFVAE